MIVKEEEEDGGGRVIAQTGIKSKHNLWLWSKKIKPRRFTDCAEASDL